MHRTIMRTDRGWRMWRDKELVVLRRGGNPLNDFYDSNVLISPYAAVTCY